MGWKLAGSSKTLEVALLEYYEKVKDPQNVELVSEVSQCKSLNVCKQAVYNNALITYANLARSTLFFPTEDISTDLAGSPRVNGTAIDIGAYECKLCYRTAFLNTFSEISVLSTMALLPRYPNHSMSVKYG